MIAVSTDIPCDVPGVSLRHYPTLTSTNDEARRLARAGAPGGTPDCIVVWSDAQTAGRGRQGRVWSSPPGNMYLTALLRPDKRLADLPQMSFVTAIAVAETVACFAPNADITLKWPNDVLVGGAKIAGILLETEIAATASDTALLVGCGLNVSFAPDDARYGATHLDAVVGQPQEIAAATVEFLKQLMHWIALWQSDGFAPIRAAWLTRAHGMGQRVSVQLADQPVEGVFSGVSTDGALQLTLPDGELLDVLAGDVLQFLGPPCC